MHQIIRKSLSGLSRQYYLRQLFFGALIGLFFVTPVINAGVEGGSAISAFSLLCVFLYPYSRFVYESCIDFILGDNIFILPIIFMLPVKLVMMVFCYLGAIFIAPMGMLYLYLRNSKEEKKAAE